MLLDRFYKPSNKMLFISLFGFVVLSVIITLLNPYIYSEAIMVNIIVFFLLGVFFEKVIIYSINWIIILFCLLYTWETIDIKINKSKYYYSFEPLMKYKCLGSYNFAKKEISQNVHCKTGLTNNESEEITTYLKNNEKTVEHLKHLGCYLIEFSENHVQFWYNDIVIDVEKTKNNTITYEISELE
jgi:uncharacterized membrane protein